TEGLVIHEASGRRSARVQVYGVDQRFWKFHGRAAGAPENWDGRDALISEGLAAELQSNAGETLLLRVEKPQAIPSESLHGRRDEQGRTLRLSSRGTLPAVELGDFSPRPQQGAVRAVFVPLGQLQRDLEQPGKANMMLLSSNDESASDERNDAAADARAQVIAQALGETFTLEDAGVKLRVLEAQQALSLESEAGLLSDELAKAAQAATQTAKLSGLVNIFSYLANGIRATSGREVPYSIVTAVDENIFAGQLRQDEAGRALNSCASPVVAGTVSASPPILLNEWAANDLGVKPGDEVSLDYYVWLDEGRLATGTHKFRVECVVPMSGSLRADRDLTPEYPGLSESESMADWDPPFPVDLKRIRPQDEDYWKTYRTTPKAFIRLDTAQRLWPSRFGNLTSIRLYPASGQPLAEARAAFAKSLRAELDPARAGFSIQAARSEALNAARGATDFGEYFLYFSFFLVASALLLAGLFFKLGIEQRLREIGLLRALGFPAAQVRHLFVGEGALLAVAGSLLGVALALGYGWLIMHGLRTRWVEAVGTRQLSLHAELVPLLAGGAGGVLAALVFIVWSLRALARRSARSLLAGTTEPTAKGKGQQATGKSEGDDMVSVLSGANRSRFATLPGSVIAGATLSLLGVGLVVGAALGKVSHVGGFFGAGTLWLAALLCFQLAWLRGGGVRRGRVLAGRGWWAMARLGFRGATSRPGRSVLCIALIAAATFIIVAVEAFRRDGQQEATTNRQSGTGGYALFAETLLPLTHNPETAEGREALNLTTTNGGAEMLNDSDAFTRFRLRPGDDASCLNLYRPQNPRILGATDAFIHSQRFSFLNSMAE
ncbi:MAG: ABC transporter permease, partial [Acidobacteriota bacterium]|nr:ABC transporter permease [Acidobacteriota bacterium]